MVTNPYGFNFIKEEEGFSSKAYRTYKDEPWTIGFGSTRIWTGTHWRKVKEGDSMGVGPATANLYKEVREMEEELAKLLKVEVTQNQYNALMSLYYNIGGDNFAGSTLLKELNAGNTILDDYFLRWHKVTVDGVKIPSAGLKARRKREWELFNGNSSSNT